MVEAETHDMQLIMKLIAERYQIQERIPHGGPVELYRAVDTQLERPVLLQILSEQAAKDEALCLRFRRHQQLAATIHHPCVQAVYDAGEWQGRPFSVLERDTGVPAYTVYEEGKAPDIRQALRITRQIAEALQFCRDAGLADWPFSYRAVRVDNEGNARLTLTEELDYVGGKGESKHEEHSGYVSSRSADDPAALATLMRVMLVGSPYPDAGQKIMEQMPPSIIAVLESMDPAHKGGMANAGEVAGALSTLEASFEAPTEAYEIAPANDRQPDPTSRPIPHLHPSQQPTVEAPVAAGLDVASASPTYAHAPDDAENRTGKTNMNDRSNRADTVPMSVRPRAKWFDALPDTAPMPQDRAVATSLKGRTARFAGAVPLLGLVLAGLLLATVVIPRLLSRPAPAEGATQDQTQSTTATPSLVVTVPDLLGKTVDEAGALAHTSGLQIGVGEQVHDANYPANTVAGQTPQPGSYVRVGSIITVTISLGPQPPSAVEQQQSPPSDHGKKEDEKKGKEKKGKDD